MSGLNQGKSVFQGSAAGTNGGATLTFAACSAGFHYTPTNIQVSGDAAAVVTVESGAGTVVMKYRRAAAFADLLKFEPNVLQGADGNTLVVKVSASTSNSEVNAQGFVVPT